MFSKFFLAFVMFLLGSFLVAPVYAAKVDSKSLRALLISADIQQQIRGATWSASVRSDDPQNLAIINDSLNALLNRKDQLDKYELKLALFLTEALSNSNDSQHLVTLNRAKLSGLKAVEKAAAEALVAVGARAAPKPERNLLIEKYRNFGSSTKIFIALLFSSAEYTREEGQNYLYTARVSLVERFDVKTFLALPTPDVAQISAQLDSPVLRERILAATQIFYLGIRNAEIHKKIIQQLERFSANKDSIADNDEAAWLIKALSAAGDINDKPLIENFVQKSLGSLQFHASLSLGLVDKFSSWYEKIESTDFAKISESQLHILLLQAPYLSIKDAAVHYIIQSRNESSEVVELCYNELKFFWPYVRRNAREVRPSARMMQMMARAGDSRYADLMKEILEKAPSKHLRAHAEENLGAFK